MPHIGDEFECDCPHCDERVTRRYDGERWPIVNHHHSFCKRCGDEIYWDENLINPKTGKKAPMDGDETAHFCEPVKCRACGEDIALNIVDGKWVPVDFENHDFDHECEAKVNDEDHHPIDPRSQHVENELVNAQRVPELTPTSSSSKASKTITGTILQDGGESMLVKTRKGDIARIQKRDFSIAPVPGKKGMVRISGSKKLIKKKFPHS
jgi:hypothetical protein